MLSAAAIVAAIFVTAAAFRPESTPDYESYEALAPSVESTSPATTSRADAGSGRLVFRHSVVPGGVYSDGELRAAMRNDPVVAAHFTTLGRTRLRTEIVPHDRMVYVSYRKGDDIYWTRNKVLLRAGETILTDGRTQIRTRCGNCISDAPVTPVAADEPEVVEFDALVEEPTEDTAEAVDAPASEGAASGPALVAGGPAEGTAPAGAAPFVFPAAAPAPFVRWGGLEAIPPSTDEQPGAQPAADDPQPAPPNENPPADDPPVDDPPAGDDPTVDPTPPDDVPPDPETNPVPVPEPSTYLLVGGGIAALLRRMRGRNATRTTTPN